MTRARWRFGSLQQHPPQEPVKLTSPVTYSADAKKFGLENFGNTCYANSVIQALYFCTPFRDLMIQEADRSNPQEYGTQSPQASTKLVNAQPPLTPNRRKPERKPSLSGAAADHPEPVTSTPTYIIPSAPPTLFSALRSLFAYISYNPSEKGTIAPRAFIEKLKEVNELFRSSMHQDAHEFLNYLLNRIVEEIEEERKRVQRDGQDLSNSLTTLSPPPTVVTVHTASSNSGTPAQVATLVHKLFEGVLTSETRCLTCETVSSRDESFLDLSIDIEKNSSVTACLRQFSASEMLSQRNKFFCDSCCGLQEAEKRMKIKKLPNILALHLKRFKYQEDVQKYIKLTYRVAFPFELRLFNTVDDAEDADRLYNLFAIVVHIGSGPHHGHYISIIKTLGQWSVFDDDNVYPIPEQDISKSFGDANAGAAYVLYYQAADIDHASLGLNSRSEEPKGTQLDSSAVSSRPSSPTQDPHPVPPFPPGLSPVVLLDNPQEPEAGSVPPLQSEDKRPTDHNHEASHPTDLHTDPNILPPHSNGITSPKPSMGSILTGLRRPASFTRPKSSHPDAKRDPGTFNQLVSPAHVDQAPGNDTPSPLKRPATSAGISASMGKQERDKNPKDTDSRPGNWFRRRSFKALDKVKHASADFSNLPPLPALPKKDDPSSSAPASATVSNGSALEPGRRKQKSTEEFPKFSNDELANEPLPRSNIPYTNPPKDARGSPHTLNNHVQDHRHRKVGGYEHSYPSGTVSHEPHAPVLPPSIISAQSSTSSAPPTISSHSASPSRHIPTAFAPSQTPRLEHRKSMQDPRGQRRKDRRPLPPIPPSPTTATAQYVTAALIGNGDAHEDVRGPARSATTLPFFPHAKSMQKAPTLSIADEARDSFNTAANQLKRASRKLSFTAPLFGIGRKDKDKHQGREKSSLPPTSMMPS